MKIGTIGTGTIVESFLAAVAQIEGIACTAVYSRTKQAGKRLAKKFQVPEVYTDLDAMLADSNINFVYVASPNSLHYEQSMQALQAGKNVICEKPFTSTTQEARKLIEFAKSQGLFLFEAITTIHLPNFRLIQGQLAKLGPIKVVQANYSQYSSRYDLLLQGELPNVFNPQFSGGALVDLNVYNIHFITRLFGEPAATHYFANKHPNGVDTSGSLVLQYPEFTATAIACKDTWGTSFAQIQGEKGYLYVNQGANGCRSFTLKLNDRQAEEFNHQHNPNLLYYELAAFKDLFLRDEYNRCNELLDHTALVMRTLERARQSANIVFEAETRGI